MKIIVEQKLRYLFRDDLFFCQEPFHSENEAIDFLAGQLEEKGMVSSEFKQLILERESISPSSYGNIAIPHPLERCAESSAIAVSIHPTPIRWGSNNVNIILCWQSILPTRCYLMIFCICHPDYSQQSLFADTDYSIFLSGIY